jgi:hypothetical protein
VFTVIHVRIGKERIEIFRNHSTTSEIVFVDNYVDIGSQIRLELVSDVEVVIRKGELSTIESPSKITGDSKLAVNKKDDTKDLTNADYVVMAIAELGRPMKSTNEILPILDRNGYRSQAKNRRSAVRYYLSTDDRLVNTPEGWALAEWVKQRAEKRQQDLFRSTQGESETTAEDTPIDKGEGEEVEGSLS